jgi:hypothetical protein
MRGSNFAVLLTLFSRRNEMSSQRSENENFQLWSWEPANGYNPEDPQVSTPSYRGKLEFEASTLEKVEERKMILSDAEYGDFGYWEIRYPKGWVPEPNESQSWDESVPF